MKRKLLFCLMAVFVTLSLACGCAFITSDNANEESNQIETAANGFWLDSGNYNTSFSGGSGSESDPYIITTPQQFAGMGYLLQNNNSTYQSSYFKLANDIDLSAHAWSPIKSTLYRAAFDGDNHKITGLAIQYSQSQVSKKETNWGLFTTLSWDYNGTQPVFKNLTIETSSQSVFNYDYYTAQHVENGGIIAGTSTMVKYENIKVVFNSKAIVYPYEEGIFFGGIVGYAFFGSFNNCFVTINASIEGGSVGSQDSGDVGGITGGAFAASFNNCVSTGEIVYRSGAFSSLVFGGISGIDTGASFTECINRVNLTSWFGDVMVGGIAAYHLGSGDISKCINYGKIKINDKDEYYSYLGNVYAAGGIVGILGPSKNESCTVSYCLNLGDIEIWGKGKLDRLDLCTGGIVGTDDMSNESSANIYVQRCINYGNISVGVSNDSSRNNINKLFTFGGIAGRFKYRSSISYCINYGAMQTSAGYGGHIGGILGEGGRISDSKKYVIQSDWRVSYCVNYGEFDIGGLGFYYSIGGMVGYANIEETFDQDGNTSSIISNCVTNYVTLNKRAVGIVKNIDWRYYYIISMHTYKNGFEESDGISGTSTTTLADIFVNNNFYGFKKSSAVGNKYTLSVFIRTFYYRFYFNYGGNIYSISETNSPSTSSPVSYDQIKQSYQVTLNDSITYVDKGYGNFEKSCEMLKGCVPVKILNATLPTSTNYRGTFSMSSYIGAYDTKQYVIGNDSLYGNANQTYLYSPEFLLNNTYVSVVITDSGVDTQDIGVNWQLSGTTKNVKVVKSDDGWYDSHFVYDSREVAALRILKNTSGAQFDSAKVYYGQKMYLRIVPKAGYYISSIAGKTTNNLKGAILGWDYNYIADPDVILSKTTYSVSLTYDCSAVSGVSQSGYVPMLNVLGVVIKNNLNYINTNLSTNEFHIFSEEDRNKYFGYNYKEEKDLTSESNAPIGYKYKLQVKYGSDYYDLTEFDFNKYQTINIQDIVDLLIEKGRLEDSSLTKYADEGGKKISFNYDTVELCFVQSTATFNVEVENLENSYYNPEVFEKVGASASKTRLFNSDDDSNIGKVKTNESVSVTVIPRYGYDYKGTQVEGSWVKSATDWDKVPNIKFTAKDILDAYLKNLTSYEKKVEALRAVENGGKDATNILMAFYYDIQKYEINLADDSTAKSVKISYVDGARSDGAGEYLRQSDLTKSIEVYYYAPVEISVDVPTSSIFDGIYFNSENGKKYLLTNYSKYAFKNDSEMNLDTIDLSIMAMSSSEGVSVSAIEPTKNTRGIYQISKPGHLVWMSGQSSNGNTFEGCYFEQTAHINLSGISFIPIGTGAAFKGSYDGQNHSIIGFGRKNDTESVFTKSSTNIGLFGRADGATFKNINMLDFNVSGSYQVGALVGFANNTKIENCHSISGINGTGVFDCYYLSSRLNSKSQEDIADNTLANLNKKLQKLVEDTTLGYTYKLEDADEDQQFKYGSLGGLVGVATNSAFVLCTNRVEFKNADEATGAYYGGIAGNADETTTFEKCLNYGKMVVSGTNLIAGGANKANIKYSLGYDSKAKSYYLYGYDGQNHIENSTDNASSIYSRLDKSVWALIDGELTLYDLYWN